MKRNPRKKEASIAVSYGLYDNVLKEHENQQGFQDMWNGSTF